jgi:hypothetical protein
MKIQQIRWTQDDFDFALNRYFNSCADDQPSSWKAVQDFCDELERREGANSAFACGPDWS